MTSSTPYFIEPIPDTEVQFRMVSIPAGTFLMGSTDEDKDAPNDEKPAHLVEIKGFYMAEYPVTQALWEAVMGQNPAHFKGAQRPVEQVSWLDAAVFCNALSQRLGKKPVYYTPQGQTYGWNGQKWQLPNEGDVVRDWEADGYCLPTEAQWEYAARAPDENDPKGHRYVGSDYLDQVGWYRGNSDSQTHEVGLLLPNAWGLYDMSGQVWEWCEDWWGNYPKIDALGPKEGVDRVIRGGGWGGAPRLFRSAFRGGGRPGHRYNNIGFRLALQSVG